MNEFLRKKAHALQKPLNWHKVETICLRVQDDNENGLLSLAEGFALSNYQFTKYFKEKAKKENSLSKIIMYSPELKDDKVVELNQIIESVYYCRDLVNEPASAVNPLTLAASASETCTKHGCSVQILGEQKLRSLRMNGLLTVGKGSPQSPTFTIIEWKPENAINKKPIVLVGKGITFDTGGYSLKTGGFMKNMKCDMSGAAVVISTLKTVAMSKMPLHIIGLVPAAGNHISSNSYTVDEIIKMHNGTTVEVINTDAEGRLILADALSYAKKYEPELVIDIATLTGAALRAIGELAAVFMGNGNEKTANALLQSGEKTYERLVRFPLFEEFAEELKSPIADMKNLGGPDAGASLAGKFLEHFTDYPWFHIDIAGPAFTTKEKNYQGIGGTGFGVRLMFDFLKNYCTSKTQ